MASFAQVVAAVAAGALLTVTAMLMFKDIQRRSERAQRSERERRIESVADASIETFLQQAGDIGLLLAAGDEDGAGAVPDTVEVWSKAHLRMLVDCESSGTVPRPGTACGQARPGRVTRRRPVPESRL